MSINSGLPGPYALTRQSILANYNGTGSGVYILGHSLTAGGGVAVRYVGRSDKDLIHRLCQHADAGKYSYFKAGFVDTIAEAYHRECWLFHVFGELNLDNECHPDCPDNQFMACQHPGCAF